MTAEEENMVKIGELLKKKQGLQNQLEKVKEGNSEKIYLTEEEVNSVNYVNQMQQSITQQKIVLADMETNITSLSEKCLKIKKELPDLEKDLKITDSQVFNGLKNKYGNFKLGENNEVIKVGE